MLIGLIIAFGVGLIVEQMSWTSLKFVSLPQSLSGFDFVNHWKELDNTIHYDLIEIINLEKILKYSVK